MKLYHGDCLEVMKEIPDKSIDAIICDLPYGTTACNWDVVIPFDKLWEQYERIIKDNSAIILFANEPFTSLLVCSKFDWFKYRIDWDKKIPSGLGYAKYRPMSQIEDICVFCRDKGKTIYNPQMTQRITPIKSGGNSKQAGVYSGFKCMGIGKEYKKTYDEKYPTTLISFDKVRQGAEHPTQKPVALLEYLIRTYSKGGDLILDNCMGSGSTGVACYNTNRHFIGIEKDDNYFKLAKERIDNAMAQLKLF